MAMLSFLVMAVALSACDEWLDDNDEGDDDEHFVRTFADHLDTPWEMVFAPDGRCL